MLMLQCYPTIVIACFVFQKRQESFVFPRPYSDAQNRRLVLLVLLLRNRRGEKKHNDCLLRNSSHFKNSKQVGSRLEVVTSYANNDDRSGFYGSKFPETSPIYGILRKIIAAGLVQVVERIVWAQAQGCIVLPLTCPCLISPEGAIGS